MLVLSRRPGEALVIGQNITVTVLGVERGVVKLGINAPKGVRILRQELLTEVRDLNLRAQAGIDPALLTTLLPSPVPPLPPQP